MSPQSPSGAEVAPVTQADREAMIQYEARRSVPIAPLFAEKVRAGRFDRDDRVQAFARHRLAEQERCAKVAEAGPKGWLPLVGQKPSDGLLDCAKRQIATTIRSTTHDE